VLGRQCELLHIFERLAGALSNFVLLRAAARVDGIENTMTEVWSAFRRFALPVFSGFLIGIATLIVLQAIGPAAKFEAPPSTVASAEEELNRCIAKTIEFVKPGAIDFDLYERAWKLCGNQIYNGVYFADFNIRREKFARQELDERVNLWMVVCITISGVLLAGVQLFMSYRLAILGRAEFAKDTSLLAEQGKISLQSSVTGVIILVVSLAFFFVYVKWIYAIQEFQIQRPDNLRPQAQVLPGGNLGPPVGR
jgi:hypothetical protein